ncbi:MAG TPA: LacI family DNA-binding transcriptional regulator, partial [Candidatus Synoicihabitans sp.]|nr:LacI family DNA-binding transcriptional regulator [Candidatus Synoicihabitans sp.]
PTLSDVGRVAGVSAMAASAVLNGARTSSRIADDTRAKILAAARKLNYRPNAAARALANRRMDTIGVVAVFHNANALAEVNQYFLEVFNGIVTSAAKHRQNTTVFPLNSWEKEADRIPSFCDGRIDGLILVAPILPRDVADLLPKHVPFVALHANTPMPNVINLESDEETGAYELVRHLITTGHKRIMHVSGPRGVVGAERRVRAYQRALRDAGLKPEPSLLVESNFSQEHARLAIRQWMKEHRGQPLPEAIFCVNDGTAIGCLEVLASLGVRVPDDVSVVGFDDTIAARTTLPQLTTVRQPLRLMGEKAVEVMLEHITHHHEFSEMPPPPIIFRTEIVHRASVAKSPGTTRLVPALHA